MSGFFFQNAQNADKPLTGRVAVVTGSTSGIGKAVAEILAQAGADIVLNGFGDAAEIEKQRQILVEKTGVRVFYSDADMSKPAEIRDMVEKAHQALGRVDILVNNAGIQHVCTVENFPEEKWDQIIAINLSAGFHATKAAAKYMKQQGGGRIINIASVHGLTASPYKAAYITAKHGMIGFTKAAALDLAEYGITVNAVCPGYVRTPLVDKQIPEQAKEYGMSEDEVIAKVMLKNHAIKDFVGIEDIASSVLYLCSDAASKITGTQMVLDGGWLAGTPANKG
ncbi:MAG: 3-hydroxybutyrate dehydrogenase [Pseudomonadota bacterium]|nr:3-hydroxybutyrate dehydrogenase [Pseudomonadota bacterium]QKK04405.1 MAG: 3-hydroxybutyrate dehydrogenase [Pseudomonadota bacterium]